MLVKNTKVCTKCKQEKLVSDFYKKSNTEDGLQYWCKECQNESNKKTHQKKKLQKRNTQLKRFSQYHLHKGLQYKLKGPRTKNSNRQEVVYNCLDCGKEVDSTLELAWAYRFKCDDCRLKGTSLPLFESKKQQEVNNKNSKLYKKLNEHKCSCHNCKETHPEENTELNNLYEWIRQQDHTNIKSRTETVKVIYIPVVKQSAEQPKAENRFIKWLKKLFNKN